MPDMTGPKKRVSGQMLRVVPFTLPREIGRLRLLIVRHDWCTYVDPSTGDEFRITGTVLRSAKPEATEEFVRANSRPLEPLEKVRRAAQKNRNPFDDDDGRGSDGY
jgi:hypothetical protein